MKTLRYVAALLLILTGLLHALTFFYDLQDANALLMLAFGILYFAIGIILFLNLKIAPALGIIFPLLGIGAGVFVIGVKHTDMMLEIMFVIDVLVIFCCSFIFYRMTR